jgi:hypothetical protein
LADQILDLDRGRRFDRSLKQILSSFRLSRNLLLWGAEATLASQIAQRGEIFFCDLLLVAIRLRVEEKIQK